MVWTFQTDTRVSKSLPKVSTENEVPGVGNTIFQNASTPQRPEAPLVTDVSQQELADAVGSVREVVARALRDLRAAGIVATSTDRIEILDPVQLHEESRVSRRT